MRSPRRILIMGRDYGSRRMAVVLRQDGQLINRKAVQRQMQEMGIAGLAPGPHTSRRHPPHPVYPYLHLLRTVTAAPPNPVWGRASTSVRLQAGWLYLVAVLDWYTRYVVAWDLDQTLERGCVREAVDRALAVGCPTIWNSAQGSPFTSPQYLSRREDRGIQISLDGQGRALDNGFTERRWRTVKYEEVSLQSYTTPREARQSLTRYFQFYNHERPHQALDYHTPAALYFGTPSTASAEDDSGKGKERRGVNALRFGTCLGVLTKGSTILPQASCSAACLAIFLGSRRTPSTG